MFKNYIENKQSYYLIKGGAVAGCSQSELLSMTADITKFTDLNDKKVQDKLKECLKSHISQESHYVFEITECKTEEEIKLKFINLIDNILLLKTPRDMIYNALYKYAPIEITQEYVDIKRVDIKSFIDEFKKLNIPYTAQIIFKKTLYNIGNVYQYIIEFIFAYHPYLTLKTQLDKTVKEIEQNITKISDSDNQKMKNNLSTRNKTLTEKRETLQTLLNTYVMKTLDPKKMDFNELKKLNESKIVDEAKQYMGANATNYKQLVELVADKYQDVFDDLIHKLNAGEEKNIKGDINERKCLTYVKNDGKETISNVKAYVKNTPVREIDIANIENKNIVQLYEVKSSILLVTENMNKQFTQPDNTLITYKTNEITPTTVGEYKVLEQNKIYFLDLLSHYEYSYQIPNKILQSVISLCYPSIDNRPATLDNIKAYLQGTLTDTYWNDIFGLRIEQAIKEYKAYNKPHTKETILSIIDSPRITLFCSEPQ